MPERRPYQAKLTSSAAEAWDRFLTRNGHSFTAIIEAVGEDLAAGGEPLPERILERAGEIDAERRSRRK